MKLLWITNRMSSDLCSTTLDAFRLGLQELGHQVTLISPQPNELTKNENDNIFLPRSSIRGLQSWSFGRSVQKFLQHTPPVWDCIVADWSVSSFVLSYSIQHQLPMTLIDRSPPADRSILASLQWRLWKRAWRNVKKSRIHHGFVVSPAHGELIESKIGLLPTHYSILGAGVDVKLFQPSTINLPARPIKFVYHGRLDKHRGILALVILISRLNEAGIQSQLTCIGEGDAMDELATYMQTCDFIFVKGRCSREQIAEELKHHHIGCLPMPNHRVWNVASPLKRSEYLASGLMVIGIDHSGHRISNINQHGFFLASQQDFHETMVNWVNALDFAYFSEWKTYASNFACEHLSWDYIVKQLEQRLQRVVDSKDS